MFPLVLLWRLQEHAAACLAGLLLLGLLQGPALKSSISCLKLCILPGLLMHGVDAWAIGFLHTVVSFSMTSLSDNSAAYSAVIPTLPAVPHRLAMFERQQLNCCQLLMQHLPKVCR